MTAYDLDDVRRFGHIDIAGFKNMKDYCYNIVESKIDDRSYAIALAFDKYVKANAARARYTRIRDCDIRPDEDRFAMFVPGVGYLTYSNPKYWDFIIELRNELLDEVADEEVPLCDTLLVNYARRLPHVVEITANKLFVVNSEYYPDALLQKCSEVFGFYFERSASRVGPDELKMANKKKTSIGYPYETVDGKPVERKDIQWGLEEDLQFQKTRFDLDWSLPKSGWREDLEHGCLGVFNEQMSLIRANVEVTPENVATLADEGPGLITICNVNQRENCPDAGKIGRKKIAKAQGLTSEKDRKFTEFYLNPETHVPDVQLDGVQSVDKINEVYDKCGVDALKYGIANRERKIYPSNNMMHTMGTVLATSALHDVEHSARGNPSTHEEVKASWENAYQYYAGKGFMCDLAFGDCQNAEVTVCTNFDTILKLVPETIRPYLRFTSHTLVPCKGSFRYLETGYCSAVWYTTFFHICKGNFENAKMVWYRFKNAGFKMDPIEVAVPRVLVALLSADEPDVAREVIGPKYNMETGCVEIGDGVCVGPYLATDDMTMQCFYRGTHLLPLDERTQKIAESSMLSFEVGELNIGFGMRQTPNELIENESSRIPKLFTSEHMGNSLKDGMATYIRILNCGHRETVDKILKKHFNVTSNDYAPYLTLYANWLYKKGATIEDDFNLFSPSERLLLGKLMEMGNLPLTGVNVEDEDSYSWVVANNTKDVINRSARISDETAEAMIEAVNKNFFGGHYGLLSIG